MATSLRRSDTAAVPETQHGRAQPFLLDLRPTPPRHPPDQLVRHGGIDMRARRELTQRGAGRLRLADPIQRARPATERFDRGKTFAFQGARELEAIVEPEPMGELGGGSGTPVDAGGAVNIVRPRAETCGRFECSKCVSCSGGMLRINT